MGQIKPITADIVPDRPTPVVRLSGEPPRDPNQSSASLVVDYKRHTPAEPKKRIH